LSEGIQSLEEAFAAAAGESDLVQSDDVEIAEPAIEAELDDSVEQAEASAGDQPEVAEADTDDDLQSLVEDMIEEQADEADEESEPSSPEITLDTEITVDLGDGAETLTIGDLVSRGMMQRDYTRKTQELAAQRQDVQEAVDFHKAFTESPMEFARALAVRAGLMAEGDRPVADINAARIQTQEQFEAAVQAEVEKRLVSDERVVAATEAQAKLRVNQEFDRIGEVHGVSIPQEVRQAILDEAARRGTGDLELLFEARLARAQAKRQRANETKLKAPSRPSAAPAEHAAPVEARPLMDVAEAFEAALAGI